MKDYCFILDPTLGKLAQKIRFLGFKAIYYNNITYSELEVLISKKVGCIVLTRKKKFYEKLKEKRRILFVKSDFWRSQLRYIIKTLNIKIDQLKIGSLCLICNSELKKVKKEDFKEIIPDYVYRTHEEFTYCEKCKKIYWKGTHVEHFIKDLLEIFRE